MNVNDFRNFVLFLAKKAQSGALTPQEFNLALERAFISWVMENYGNSREYLPGRPIPRIKWQETQKITDDLRFLLEKREFSTPQGRLDIPNGTTKDLKGETAPKYLHISSLRYRYLRKKGEGYTGKEVKIRIVRDDELAHLLTSELVTPTTRFPAAAFYNTFIQVHPTDIQNVIFTYLREPTIPKWGFTLDTKGRPVYNAATSVDIESPADTINIIAFKVLSYLGISIREPQLIQYAEVKDKTGE